VTKPRIAMQCTERATSRIGDFLHHGDFIAISPIFPSYSELHAWMRENGHAGSQDQGRRILDVAKMSMASAPTQVM
jgi:hypothetical protein